MISEKKIEELVNEMEKVFDNYSLGSGKDALTKIIKEWYENNKDLISLLSKHPNWNPEKFYITFDSNVDRTIDANEVHRFYDWVYRQLRMESSKWTKTLKALSCHAEHEINARIAALAAEDYPDLRIVKGQKSSKATNKILTSIGFSGREYQQRYADYSDAVNPLQIVRHTVISVNPIDYLLASNGNSWSSCHTIDKHNPNGYSGCRCSGTLSYMMDGSSLVYYQVDAAYNGNDMELQPKIVRQMFHYENGMFIQGRLYPQCHDGQNSLYTPIREIMQKVFADCLGLPNLWRKKRGIDTCRAFSKSTGTHYTDYLCQSECSVSRIFDMIPEGKDDRVIHIGHKPYCIICGKEHSYESQLYCSDVCLAEGQGTFICSDCGELIESEEDVYWVDGEPYCEHCVRYCDECQEYCRAEDVTYYNELGGYVCDNCAEDYYRCDRCGELIPDGDEMEDAHGNTYCRSCAENHLVEVDGEYYPHSEVTVCRECGAVFVNGAEYHEYCDDCREEEENER